MNSNTTITWQYAQSFNENEKKWEEVKTLLIAKTRVITKNALLTMIMIDDCCDATEMIKAIEAGDRSQYLYDRAKKAVDEAAALEEVGEIFYQAFGKALSKTI